MKILKEQTEFETAFVVMPRDCNYLGDMLHGGALMGHMDRAAAMSVRRALYGTGINTALTVGADQIKFLVGAALGDLVLINAKVTKVGVKSIQIDVVGWREDRQSGERESICSGVFTFCTVGADRKGIKHGLEL